MDTDAIALHDTIVSEQDPLQLELADDEFIDTIDALIEGSQKFYQKKHLYERQEKNLKYYIGDQLKIGGKDGLKEFQPKFVENIVYEGVMRIKPIATSQLPDMTVKSSDDITTADTLTDLLNTDAKKRANRKLIGLAHVHEQLFFYAVIKARWNPEKGDDGDYEYINIFPNNIVWDQNCKTNNADDMMFVAENAELRAKQVMMMFPKTADALTARLGFNKPLDTTNGETQEKRLASPIKIWEVWFHWWKETKDPDTKESKWEKIHAVVWKYDNLVLGKMRNPYFDYEGKPQLFDPTMQEVNGLSEAELMKQYFDSIQQPADTIYYNYFRNPRKPYYFMVYESLGRDPIDETNRIEQILTFQDHINDTGRQIIEMNDRSTGKPVINGGAIDKEEAKNLDWRNTRQAVVVNTEDVNKAFAVAQMPEAPQGLYNAKQENRSIAFEMLGLNDTTRGVQQSGDVTLGQSQMFREQDFGFIDDLAENTINEFAEWQGGWTMQMIRLFYTKDHMVQIVGKDGESVFTAINQNYVSQGMVVEVSASAVDKMMRKQLAVQNMKMGVGDLLSYYEDTDQSNPKERAYRAFLQQSSPQMYAQQYLVPDSVASPKPGAQPGAQNQPPAPQPGMPPNPGQPPAPGAGIVSTDMPLPNQVQRTTQFAPAPPPGQAPQ